MRLESRLKVEPQAVDPVGIWDPAGKAEQSKTRGRSHTAGRRLTIWNLPLISAIIVFQVSVGALSIAYFKTNLLHYFVGFIYATPPS
jgi:hypothetical protein